MGWQTPKDILEGKNEEDKLNDKTCECSQCNDSGVVYLYNKDGDVTSRPCPRCAEDVIAHIRNWKEQMFDG